MLKLQVSLRYLEIVVYPSVLDRTIPRIWANGLVCFNRSTAVSQGKLQVLREKIYHYVDLFCVSISIRCINIMSICKGILFLHFRTPIKSEIPAKQI